MAKLPDNPNTRLERYLARLAGQDVSIPDTPITRIECYLAYLIENGGGAAAPNAGAHNAIFRGKSLGSTFTEAQRAAIQAGTFEDIFIGDYWTMEGINYRVAALDQFLNMGDVPMQKHHAVIVPDTPLYNAVMNSDGGVAGGYQNSALKTSGLDAALATVRAGFGEAHVLSYRNYMTTAATSVPTNGGWASSYIDLMSEGNVVGRGSFGTISQNGFNLGVNAGQFPLFALEPRFITCRAWYWLRDVQNSTHFTGIDGAGAARTNTPDTKIGVRPYFLVGKAS